MVAYADNNPKTIYGSRKPDLSLIPPSALIYMALGFMNGADKYGPYNWRANKVAARVYVAAAMRHLAAYLDGEDTASDSGFPHLGHAMACLAIVADATETDCLIDDRPINGVAGVVLDRWTKTAVNVKTPPDDEKKAPAAKKKGKSKNGH